MDDYRDIINRPHHQSEKHPHMSMHDRAAQFAPFAALRGFDDEISETARRTDRKLELNAEQMGDINERLRILADNIQQKPEVEITYFVPDKKKDGGAYVTITGNIRRIDEVERFVYLTDGTRISVDDLYSIKSELFDAYPGQPDR